MDNRNELLERIISIGQGIAGGFESHDDAKRDAEIFLSSIERFGISGESENLNKKKADPKEFATEFANKFVSKSIFVMDEDELSQERLQAKRMAIIAVKELCDTSLIFWKEVIEEIEKLNS